MIGHAVGIRPYDSPDRSVKGVRWQAYCSCGWAGASFAGKKGKATAQYEALVHARGRS